VFLGRQIQGLVDHPRWISAAHITFTVAREAPKHVVSQIRFRAWYFKLEVLVVGRHNRRLPDGVILLGVVKLTLEVKCIVQSAASRIALVSFCYSLYESRVQVFVSQV